METNKPEIVACGLDQSGIDKLKAKHGRIFAIDIDDDGEKLEAICKEPDTTVMSAINSMSKTDEVKGALLLYNSCVLEADKEIKNSELLKLRVSAAIGYKIERINFTVKKL